MSDRSAVILGAGITGVLVARQLLLDGWDVTVLEAAHVGAGSSSRTAAGIRQQFSTASTVRGMRHSVAFYRAFGEEVGQACMVSQGYLFLHAEEASWSDARARVALQQEAGLAEVEALEAGALRERFPFLAEEGLVGGTWCPTDGFLLPQVVYQEGARRVRELGGRIVARAPVERATRAGGRLRAVHTPKGVFHADLFVDATNAWTGRTAAVLGGERLRVDPIKRYLWFVQRSDAMPAEVLASMPMVISPAGVYGRPENRDTLLMGWAIGGEAEEAFSWEDQDVVPSQYAHDAGVDAVPIEAWMHFAEAVPDVGLFDGITATTAGYYAVTPDHNPFLGFDPRTDNLLRLVGFSGHGAMFGPFTATVAAQLADVGRDLDEITLDEGPVSLTEFAIGRTFGPSEAMVI